MQEFEEWRISRSKELGKNIPYEKAALVWMNQAIRNDYSYLFTWLGVPVIQFPSDIFLIQEAIFRSRANKIVEVGIARGGTTIFLASLIKLIHGDKDSAVIGVDIQISPHTRIAVEKSVVRNQITFVEGNSTSEEVVAKVRQLITKDDIVLVILDSNHTEEHVYNEMELYGELVTPGAYLVVMDTAIEYVDSEVIAGKPWGKGNNPLTAINRYHSKNRNVYHVDSDLDSRSLPGAARKGFLRKSI